MVPVSTDVLHSNIHILINSHMFPVNADVLDSHIHIPINSHMFPVNPNVSRSQIHTPPILTWFLSTQVITQLMLYPHHRCTTATYVFPSIFTWFLSAQMYYTDVLYISPSILKGFLSTQMYQRAKYIAPSILTRFLSTQVNTLYPHQCLHGSCEHRRITRPHTHHLLHVQE